MVSPLFKASTVGDVAQVTELLKDANSIDIEVKDHTGATPLIQAVRGGHVEVVRVLLEAGADPRNASSMGSPEHYSSNPAILELLSTAAAKSALQHPPPPPPPQLPVTNGAQPPPPAPVPGPYPPHVLQYPAPYYGPPQPVPYGAQPFVPYPPPPPGVTVAGPNPPVPFHPIPPPPHHMQQQQQPFQPLPPPPPQAGPPGAGPIPPQQNGAGPGSPPQGNSRNTPCKFYPNCKFGAQCRFQHPQPTPQLPAPMAPAQYPPPVVLDGMSPPIAFHPLPGPFYPAPGMYPGPPPPASHPGSPMHHIQSIPPQMRGAEVVVSPIMVGPSLPPGMSPYGMPAQLSPYSAHPGLPPIAMVGPPSAMASPLIYPGSVPMLPTALPPTSPPYHARRDSVSVSSFQPAPGFSSPLITQTGLPTSPRQDALGFAPMSASHHVREGSHPQRNRSGRAPVGGAARKPCLFFPSGRCRNGNTCRFPHVMPEAGAPSVDGIESKLANMGLGETNGNGNDLSNGFKVNGFAARPEAQSPSRLQRLPVAADFPALSDTKASSLTNGSGNGIQKDASRHESVDAVDGVTDP